MIYNKYKKLLNIFAAIAFCWIRINTDCPKLTHKILQKVPLVIIIHRYDKIVILSIKLALLGMDLLQLHSLKWAFLQPIILAVVLYLIPPFELMSFFSALLASSVYCVFRAFPKTIYDFIVGSKNTNFTNITENRRKKVLNRSLCDNLVDCCLVYNFNNQPLRLRPPKFPDITHTVSEHNESLRDDYFEFLHVAHDHGLTFGELYQKVCDHYLTTYGPMNVVPYLD